MKVSLVVPVKNESDSIERLISSAAAQTRRPDEIVIVDGGSDDGTAEIIENLAHCNHWTGWVRVIRTGGATPGKGRNLGVVNARYDWIAFIDAGMQAEQFWLERLTEVAARDDQVAVVYGSYEPMIETFFDRCAALAYVSPKQLRDGRWMRGPVIPSSLIRREVWQKVGGFQDLRAAEDLIFMDRIVAAGFKTGLAPDATVWWRLRPDLSTTFRKFVLYSKHNVWAGMQRYWHYGLIRQYLIWLAFLPPAVFHRWWWAAAPIGGYLIRVAKSIWIRREGRGLIRALNPVQFIVVTIILLTIDLATFIGWTQACWQSERAS